MSNRPIELTIAYIGGGSRGWAHILMGDLATCPDLTGVVRLYDIDVAAAELNATLGNWLQGQPGVQSAWRYEAVASLAAALRGADFVFISIQPGELALMAHEIAIAERYGLFFPVGDTTGVPGLMRGVRATLRYAQFAQAIAATCPRAWVVNYSNPMTICTRTLTKVAPGLKVFGCCHEVFGTQQILAELAQTWLNLPAQPPRAEIRVNVLGINHFTWLDRATYAGHDLLSLLRAHVARPGVLRPFSQAEVEAQDNWFFDGRQVKFELFRRYGLLPAAGDRHLCEFVPGFTRSPAELFRWGIIRTPISYRIDRWRLGTQRTRDLLAGREPLQLQPSSEEMVQQLRALVGLGDLVTNVNIANIGQVADLPLGAVVETNARFRRDEVQPLAAGRLPPGVHALVARHVANQEMIVEGALTRDKDSIFQAIFADPTTNLPIDQAWRMFEEIGLPEGFLAGDDAINT